MAVNFLDHDFQLADAVTEGLQHHVDLYESGGDLFMRIWISGRGNDMPLCLKLTADQARQFADGAERLATRLGF